MNTSKFRNVSSGTSYVLRAIREPGDVWHMILNRMDERALRFALRYCLDLRTRMFTHESSRLRRLYPRAGGRFFDGKMTQFRSVGIPRASRSRQTPHTHFTQTSGSPGS